MPLVEENALILDGNALLHRSFHAVKFAPCYQDMEIGAVYGFASTLINALEVFHPKYFVVAFDTKEPTYRHKVFTEYKAQRSKPPEGLYEQLPLIEQLINSFDISIQKIPGYEADDIIGTIAKKCAEKKIFAKILSGDYDFLQLVSDYIQLVKFNGNLYNALLYNEKETIAKLGITPQQVVDYKAICGDSSDNYKGVEGLGPKNASKLLQKYKSLEKIYNSLDSIPEKIREKLIQNKESAFLCQNIAAIQINTPIKINIPNDIICHPSAEKVSNFLQEVGFYALDNRYKKFLLQSQNQDKTKKIALPPRNTTEQTSFF